MIEEIAPSGFLYFKMGFVNYKNLDYKNAIINLEKCLNFTNLNDTFLHTAYYTMGLCYACSDKYEEAIKPYSEAIALNNTNNSYYHERAKCYLLIDEF